MPPKSTAEPKHRHRSQHSAPRSAARRSEISIPSEPGTGLRARVMHSILEGANQAPFRRGLLRQLLGAFKRKRSVSVVERSVPEVRTSVLYAPDGAGLTRERPFVETEFVTTAPSAETCDGTLVYRDSPFEIRVAGMLVKNFDKWVPGPPDNELLMYSVQMDPNSTGDTGHSLPFIHFDYRRDGSKSSERPNMYIPIPASTSFVAGSRGRHGAGFRGASPTSSPGNSADDSTVSCTSALAGNLAGGAHEGAADGAAGDPASDFVNGSGAAAASSGSALATAASVGARDGNGARVRVSGCQKSVNVQFRVLEIDTVSESVTQTVAGIDALGNQLAGYSSAAPFLGILSPVINLAGAVGKRALDSYALPDRVFSLDMDFLLADRRRVQAGTARPGEYLRYGYYFFLSEPIEGRLYASTGTPKNVELMLRRTDVEEERRPSDRRKEFFPLTEVSYIVVRVVEPSCRNQRSRKPIQMTHALQLESIFRDVRAQEDHQSIVKSLKKLGDQLGIFDSDDEENEGEQKKNGPK